MTAVIIEDEQFAVERLMQMLSNEEIEIVNVFDTVDSAVNYLKFNSQPDLIFMDIELGDGKSFDIFSKVEVYSHIIFITAFDKYAIKAFKFNSIDYLLKPLRREELEHALAKFRSKYFKKTVPTDYQALIEQLGSNRKYKNRILIKLGDRLSSINTSDIAYVYTKDKIKFVKTFNNKDHIIDLNIDELEEQLNPDEFYRVNRQFLINFKSIEKIFSWFDGKLKVLVSPNAYEDIIVSRLKANEFKKWLDN